MAWSARVHKSGSQVQLIKNGSVAKVIKAGDDTFKATAEDAQKYATRLIETLNAGAKVAKQMTDGDAKPTVATPAEVHDTQVSESEKDAKGTDALGKKASDVIRENTILRKKIAKLEKESTIERKARRGLAIVKELVAQNKVANNEESVRTELMKITAMSNDEIVLLERKVASLPLYESKDEAARESRRYARLARLHTASADDAQLVGDIKTADAEHLKADHFAALSDQANKFAYSTDGEYAPFKSEAAPSKPDDAVNQAEDEAKGKDVNGDMPKHASRAREIYLKIAADHEDLAKLAESENDLKKAATEREVAAEARELASHFASDKAACGMDNEAADENLSKESTVEAEAAAETATTKEATVEAEATAETPAKEASVEAEAAAETATTKEAAAEDDKKEDDDETEKKAAAASYRKIAAYHRKRADEFENLGQPDKADAEDKIADSAENMALEHESMFKKEGDPAPELAAPAPAPAPMLDPAAAPAPALNTELDATVNTNDDAGLDTDGLWGNNDDSSNGEEAPAMGVDHDQMGMPSDNDIAAAMNYSSAPEMGEEEMAAAGDNSHDVQPTRNLDSIAKAASANLPEENPFAGSVSDLEGLWSKE